MKANHHRYQGRKAGIEPKGEHAQPRKRVQNVNQPRRLSNVPSDRQGVWQNTESFRRQADAVSPLAPERQKNPVAEKGGDIVSAAVAIISTGVIQEAYPRNITAPPLPCF